jgi:hypothetical protein
MDIMKNRWNWLLVQWMVAAAAVALAPADSRATIVYDAATDFSGANNPSSVWSYGWSATLGGAFTTDIDVQNLGSGVVQWRGNQPANADGNPSVFKNTSGSEVTLGSIKLPGNSLAFHPGSAGQFSVVRFTAPSAGDYSISAAFTGRDFSGPTSTDVHVLVNSSSQFDDVVNGFLFTTTFGSQTFALAQGGTIDFVVGYDGGPGGKDEHGANFGWDSTGLAATVTPVPEATTLIAGALLLLPFGASTVRMLRRRA